MAEDLKQYSLPRMQIEANPDGVKKFKSWYDNAPSEERNGVYNLIKPICEEFFKTDGYKNTKSTGYAICCDILGLCGMSGWWIFFIILIVIGCLAAAGAAFWFFYLKRKMGGRDEKEEDVDSEESSTKKSDYDISIDTY